LSECVGQENLENISISQNFTNWMYQEIFPRLKGNILEIESCLGTYSKRTIKDFPES